jgi:hypothetical protein
MTSKARFAIAIVFVSLFLMSSALPVYAGGCAAAIDCNFVCEDDGVGTAAAWGIGSIKHTCDGQPVCMAPVIGFGACWNFKDSYSTNAGVCDGSLTIVFNECESIPVGLGGGGVPSASTWSLAALAASLLFIGGRRLASRRSQAFSV